MLPTHHNNLYFSHDFKAETRKTELTFPVHLLYGKKQRWARKQSLQVHLAWFNQSIAIGNLKLWSRLRVISFCFCVFTVGNNRNPSEYLTVFPKWMQIAVRIWIICWLLCSICRKVYVNSRVLGTISIIIRKSFFVSWKTANFKEFLENVIKFLKLSENFLNTQK